VPLRVMGDRMKLTGITVDAGTQKAWDAVWKANNMDVWSKEVQDRGFKFGDSYMRAWPDEPPTTPAPKTPTWWTPG
jgi:hypothetical protein